MNAPTKQLLYQPDKEREEMFELLKEISERAELRNMEQSTTISGTETNAYHLAPVE